MVLQSKSVPAGRHIRQHMAAIPETRAFAGCSNKYSVPGSQLHVTQPTPRPPRGVLDTTGMTLGKVAGDSRFRRSLTDIGRTSFGRLQYKLEQQEQEQQQQQREVSGAAVAPLAGGGSQMRDPFASPELQQQVLQDAEQRSVQGSAEHNSASFQQSTQAASQCNGALAVPASPFVAANGLDAATVGPLADSPVDQISMSHLSNDIIDEILLVNDSHRKRTTYLIGRTRVRAIPNRNILKRVVVGCYRFIANNTNPSTSAWALPTDCVLEVGLTIQV